MRIRCPTFGHLPQMRLQNRIEIDVPRFAILRIGVPADGYEFLVKIHVCPPNAKRLLFPCAAKCEKTNEISELPGVFE